MSPLEIAARTVLSDHHILAVTSGEPPKYLASSIGGSGHGAGAPEFSFHSDTKGVHFTRPAVVTITYRELHAVIAAGASPDLVAELERRRAIWWRIHEQDYVDWQTWTGPDRSTVGWARIEAKARRAVRINAALRQTKDRIITAGLARLAPDAQLDLFGESA